jgi:hypothetical protein
MQSLNTTNASNDLYMYIKHLGYVSTPHQIELVHKNMIREVPVDSSIIRDA